MSEIMSIQEYKKHLRTNKKKGNKFNAKKTPYNGVIYDSQKEADRRAELDILMKAGEIVSVEDQPEFDCVINGKKTFKYKADFKITYPDGTVRIEDVKGYKKGASYATFRVKKKVVEALFGVEIIEI